MTQEQDVANFTWEEKVNYLKMRLPSIDKEIERLEHKKLNLL